MGSGDGSSCGVLTAMWHNGSNQSQAKADGASGSKALRLTSSGRGWGCSGGSDGGVMRPLLLLLPSVSRGAVGG